MPSPITTRDAVMMDEEQTQFLLCLQKIRNYSQINSKKQARPKFRNLPQKNKKSAAKSAKKI